MATSKKPPEPTTAEAAVSSPINWIQLAGIISSLSVFLGFPVLDPVDVSKVILGIQSAATIATVLIETYRNARV